MAESLVKRARAAGSEFGAVYAALSATRKLAHEVAGNVEQRLLRIEGARGVLGPAHRRYSGHSSGENSALWTEWDWSKQGEEWTVSADWKASLVEHVLLPNMPDGGTIVEIGPGGGRWTEILLGCADRLILVDVTNRTLEVCRERFGDPEKLEYVLSDGSTLVGVSADSVDAVWSFDVFVHIAPPDIDGYLSELARVLKPGAEAVIHHSGRVHETLHGWRSPMTAKLFSNLAHKHGLETVRQFDSWGDGRFDVRTYGDVITILRPPCSTTETS